MYTHISWRLLHRKNVEFHVFKKPIGLQHKNPIEYDISSKTNLVKYIPIQPKVQGNNTMHPI